MTEKVHDVCVIGGGIVGLASALALLQRDPGLRLVLLEKEGRLAAHQTGHNSGVIHSGLYYRPGSLKASNCVSGRERIYSFCEENGLAFERCGKLVIATREDELPALDELERRGRLNGLNGLVRLDASGLRQYEPHAAGIAGLWVAETGIVDFAQVARAFGSEVRRLGGDIRLGAKARAVAREAAGLRIDTPQGTVRARYLINCAGLHSDRVARWSGVRPPVRIIPFRGEYYTLRPECRQLVRNLIYPVPDPAFPFLGVHLTRMIDGQLEAGPNAVLALKREGYTRLSISLRDLAETLTWPGFWKMAQKFWKVGLGEYHRSWRKSVFAGDLQRLVPDLRGTDLLPGGAGVRAQAVDEKGGLVDDFCLLEAEGMLHVLNAPSPAATASLSIGQSIADKVAARLGL
ncbi:hydroxyglutarate oxidase [Desulfuromonas versatilis]|uniref:Hydroxyglutarate oxidase n=1 Tax=Desulfuromonas versatilis TaxID=2802975 RepID=A0ABM8HXV1_9BACT|nr:L-2-hydroxyglutarate oxidase [Desulfuromonas versatilis]BCR05934.1 hydroxyglutarate oxidase [Desulfuromonas versatilis]